MYSQFRLEALAKERVVLELEKVYWETTFPQQDLKHIERQISYLDSQIEIVKRNAPIELAEMGANMAKSMLEGLDDNFDNFGD